MEGASLSPGVVRMVGTAAARVSFAESSELLAELAGLRGRPEALERAAEALGGEIAEDECLRVEVGTALGPDDGPGHGRDRSAGAPGGGGRRSQDARVKLVTLWTAESLDPQGRPRATRARSGAAIESAATRNTDPDLSAFARRVGREAERRGFGLAKRQVVVGDGAPWIWNVTAEQFPEAIEIVDLYHATGEDLASKALHAGDPPAFGSGPKRVARGSAVWMTFWERLRSGAAEASGQCAEYRAQSRPDAVRRLPCPRTFRWFRCRRAGCKTTIGARLKRAGMH